MAKNNHKRKTPEKTASAAKAASTHVRGPWRAVLLLLLAQALLFVVLLQGPAPEEKLEWSWWHLLPVALWLGWLRARRPWTSWWRYWLASFALAQVAFLIANYYLRGSASLVFLATGFVPLAVWGAIAFARWNWACLHNREALRALAMSALSWGLMALAYPPLPLGPGALVFLVPWFLVLWRASQRAAMFATFWSGFLFYAISYYWIYNVAKVGPAPAILSGLFLLISYFALYNTVAGWVFVKGRDLRIGNIPVLVVLYPLFWAGLEVTRTRGDFSFPWSPLGLVFGQQVQWLQGLAFIGVFGYSILIVASNLSVAYAVSRRRWTFALVPVVVLAAVWAQGAWVLSDAATRPFAIAPGSDSLRVAMVQPSIHQTKKWSKAYYDTVMTKTWGLVDTLQTKDLDLIVLPETAIPDFIRMRFGEQKKIRRYIARERVPMFLGALDHDVGGTGPRRFRYYNAGLLFDTNGVMTRYHKMHLVPFSERLPFDDVFPLLNYVDLGEGDFTPGDSLPVFAPGAWTPMICYEAIYGNLMRQAVRQGAKLIVNITNDGWFGRSTAPGQHLNLVRYRAIETGVPVARCANSGISAFIDARGHYYGNTALFEEAVIRKTLPMAVVPTLYAQIGDAVEGTLFVLFFAWFGVLVIWRLKRKQT